MNRNLREGLRWLEQSERDLKTAEVLLQAELYDVCCFHCQQGAEKALKAFLYSKGLRAVLTHSILNLLEDCSRYDKVFDLLRGPGRELDRHYVASRYPTFYPDQAPIYTLGIWEKHA